MSGIQWKGSGKGNGIFECLENGGQGQGSSINKEDSHQEEVRGETPSSAGFGVLLH